MPEHTIFKLAAPMLDRVAEGGRRLRHAPLKSAKFAVETSGLYRTGGMARRSARERIEPKLGDAGFAIGAEDRPARGGAAGRKKRKKERAGRRARRARGSLFARLVRRTVYWSFVFCIWGAIAAGGVVAYYAAQLPGASEWRVPERPPNVQVVAIDGRVIGNRGDTGGEAVRLAELPDYVPNAVIAIEDRRFRSHFGVDPLGILRAALRNVSAGDVTEGGSTLTQQLAKNMFLTPERSLKRKVQEVVLAVWLESRYSKDEILEMYLNRVYFGAGAYGVQAAAQRYFSRDASELTLSQAAMLAGLLPAPSYYAPNRNPERAKARAALVLAAMEAQGLITPGDEERARESPAQAATLQMSRSENYVADWVMDVLPSYLGAVEQDVVVETTLDLNLQEAAERALTQTLDAEGEKYDVSEGALVALDGTGAVRALVGGRSYAASQFNRAVDARRQPGSAFKPFVYLTAIERGGLRPDTVRFDEPVAFGNWSPKNSNGKYRGPVTLKEALALSINTVAAQLAYEVGPQAVVETAKRMGINSPLAANPSIALGTSEVTLIELTGAYAPFSNGGYAVAPFVIQRIRTPDGTVLFDRQGSGLGMVASMESVALMNDMMQATVEMGTGTRAALPGWQVAGKTGTSQDFRDAWFLGYTANLTAGVWVGNDSNAATEHASGANLPAMIWAKFMTAAHEGVPVTPLPGADLLAGLLSQPVGLIPGWDFSQLPGEAISNEDRARMMTIERASGGEGPMQPAPVRGERRGFFGRLFGG
jgi:penicillin-binding protein 1A